MSAQVPDLPPVGPPPAVHATGGGDIAAPGTPSPVEQPAADGETVHSPSAAPIDGWEARRPATAPTLPATLRRLPAAPNETTP